MKQKHYYLFEKEVQKKMSGNCLSEENWDILRNDEVDGPISIEKTVESYENNCRNNTSYYKVANIIVNKIKEYSLAENKVVSCGIGKGILEWHIKKICPELYIECTDYTEEAIETLKKVFLDMDDGHTFNMLNGDYRTLGVESTILMYRVSTEFDREQWDKVFKKMYEEGMKHVIFVPAGLDTKKTMKTERKNHIRNILRLRKSVFCGWLYSEDEFLGMFRGTGMNPLYTIKEKVSIENTVSDGKLQSGLTAN